MNNLTAMVFVILIAFALTAVLGIPMVPFLRRLKFGQTILDIGPSWHKKKQGTPTMGGLMFVVGIIAAVSVGYFFLQASDQGWPTDGIRLFSAMMMAFAFAAVGFLDDYIKVVKKQNLGLTARQKYIMQLIIAVFYLLMLYIAGDRSTMMTIPFLGSIQLGLFYYPAALIIITGFVNAVNLTDGVDGLASSVTFVYAVVMLVVAMVMRIGSSQLMACALIGGTLGFLIWNFNPAKVFMGDTGSLFLGGLVVGLAFDTGLPLFLIFTGVIYWAEAFSVILQVISFKTTGKRIFKMSPIHHHFEMSGWSEVKIVTVFSFITLIGGVLAVIGVMQL